ncbi:hydrophobic protein [Xylanimonas cellulosilytica DSM 15894]|uniref:Hydrophobic protein n=1 Tax=Xylanimonas cellulosilytica (strain DSM 15894 / JCM 12276 / CECT 5975 / KCTC 9989 / LMG 20990 / NBRC 107835 / XIL07) TaxID=446471 RepID=D1BRK8_XYLCX|nr:hydrophobic protein [Xylanimonas cellulosilytica]ACZ32274.1 hydrophobic protein [Xylanimonas cellulosilytica DSM 15894]
MPVLPPARRVRLLAWVSALLAVAALAGAAPAQAAADPVAPQIAVRGHVQSIGWQPWRTGNGVVGTTGRALRLEALQLKLTSSTHQGGILAQAHVQNIGWTDYVPDGATIGTTGRGLRVEAVTLGLTGEVARYYDLWYRAHIQNHGWLAWTSNGSPAGSAEESLRIEALEIRLLPKGSAAPAQSGNRESFIYWQNDPGSLILAQAHVQNIGWQDPVRGGTVLGTTGRGLRLEALNLNYLGDGPLTAQAHVQNRGWMAPVSVSHNGGIVGTEGQGLRMEAIRLNLPSSSEYRIYYRTHVQNIGWTGWATNGQSSGSAGFGYRMEAVDVRVVLKGKSAPASNGVPAFFQR